MNEGVGTLFNQKIIRKRIEDLLNQKTKSSTHRSVPKSSKKRSQQTDGEVLKDIFHRVVRDGAAEEIKNAVLDAQRDIEQHAKLNRLSKEAVGLFNEFNRCSEQYLQKKKLLEKLEKTLDQFRKTNSNNTTGQDYLAKIDHYLGNAEKIRKDLIQDIERLLNIKDRLDVLMQKDRNTLESLQETLKRCFLHLPAKERGKRSSSVPRAGI